ncbi:O-antigen ligase family protein [Endozoicomonas sp. ALD040]|uniref:O-antigen ligase family protein n=1 Tax=Endozoicomonas sp. ALD040 TaxID=3403079 RepID=UPI003BAEE924
MIFYQLFSFSLLLLVLNVGMVFNVGFANPIEKSFLLLSALVLIFRRHFDHRIIAILFVILMITLFSAILSDYSDFSWIIYGKALFQIITIFIFLSARLTEAEIRFVLKVVTWLPTFSILIGMFYWVAFGRSIFSYEFASGLPRLQGSLIPAYLGAYCIAGCYSSLRYADTYDIRYLWLVFINTVILILTGGRMALFIGALLCFPVFWGGFKNYMNLKRLIIIAAAIFLILFLILLGDIIIGRIFQTHLSGREIIWDYLNDVLAKHWWFGVGYGHQATILPDEVRILVGGTISAHNEYLRVAVEIGYIQTIVFYSLLLLALILKARLTECTKPFEIIWSSILFLLICITENAISSVSGFLFLIVVVMTRMEPMRTSMRQP